MELAAMTGLDLDPWQEFALKAAMGERDDGRWAALEVGVEAPRQNGKNGLTEARQLAGLFLLDENYLIHSAHEFATAEEALNRMEMLIGDTPALSKRLKAGNRGVKRSHGQEGIYLKSGQRLRYRTRTKGGGRGLTCNCLFLDEAMHLPDAMINALFFTLSAVWNPQIWYTGSAVDEETMPDGHVFARLRARAIAANDPGLAYFGWSAPFEHPDRVPEGALDDPEVWAMANPALGRRISLDFIRGERRSVSRRGFAVERLGVGAWPAVDGSSSSKISREAWAACVDPDSSCTDPVQFVFDVTPNRSSSVIGVAGLRLDGQVHIEIVDERPGTGWVAARLAELVKSHEAMPPLYEERGPAASLAPDIEALEVALRPVKSAELAQACGMFFDAVEQRTVHHRGTPELAQAVRGAATRPLGDAWAWARKASGSNIAPLVAVTLAHWGVRTMMPDAEPLIAFI